MDKDIVLPLENNRINLHSKCSRNSKSNLRMMEALKL